MDPLWKDTSHPTDPLSHHIYAIGSSDAHRAFLPGRPPNTHGPAPTHYAEPAAFVPCIVQGLPQILRDSLSPPGALTPEERPRVGKSGRARPGTPLAKGAPQRSTWRAWRANDSARCAWGCREDRSTDGVAVASVVTLGGGAMCTGGATCRSECQKARGRRGKVEAQRVERLRGPLQTAAAPRSRSYADRREPAVPHLYVLGDAVRVRGSVLGFSSAARPEVGGVTQLHHATQRLGPSVSEPTVDSRLAWGPALHPDFPGTPAGAAGAAPTATARGVNVRCTAHTRRGGADAARGTSDAWDGREGDGGAGEEDRRIQRAIDLKRDAGGVGLLLRLGGTKGLAWPLRRRNWRRGMNAGGGAEGQGINQAKVRGVRGAGKQKDAAADTGQRTGLRVIG
eukprot:TRINITY_DN23272_c0_g1_i1.p1 TRINITY_DN23272_c0_g1~~TRINITY_DN23272_c0_g1_i1.p1  ORF type:complete len:396 (-),score=-56.67 TRINITY_DN23272_c0_g1_i1:1298-2485(-)